MTGSPSATASGPGTYDTSVSRHEQKGLGRFRMGAWAGFVGAVAAIGLPFAFLWLAAYNPGGIFTFDSTLLQYTNWLLIAGALMFLVSLMMYRWGFSALRKEDSRFNVAIALCWIGSIGFILIIVVASYFLGSLDSIAGCIRGQPTQALSCLNSQSPLGAATVVVGFWLGWLGSVGIVIGLFIGGGRIPSVLLTVGGVLYLLLLLVLVLPFASLLTHVPGLSYIAILAPLFGILAPLFVLGGARRSVPSAASA
ncbi:MAG: hypothetical protein HKL79_00745 [Thermoplasmata archaeon]|nr:hypothetical protein [Thermoplasmata archaeon]